MTVKRYVLLFFLIACLSGVNVYAETVHRVQQGETLSGIAKTYSVTVDSVWGNNQYIINPDLIFPGQVLIIPEENRQFYIVKKKDTLSKISKDFNIPIPMLAFINDIENPDILYEGQILIVPKRYTVEAEDTLDKIAVKLNVTLEELLIENNLTASDTILPGQSLIVPFRSRNREEPAAIDKELSPMALKYPDTFFYKGNPKDLEVALTFDDGPSGLETEAVLDVLKEHQAPSTFFLLGTNIPSNSDIVKRILAEGHTLASHTMDHADLRNLTDEQLRSEMLKFKNEVYEITGLRTSLMRPPYGFLNDEVVERLRQMDYKIIKWSVDSNDWRDKDVDAILINTIPNIRNGSIILMHDYLNDPATKEALPEIIHSLKVQGYRLVTVDELLNIEPYK